MISVLKSEHLDYQGSTLSSVFFKIDKKTVLNRIHQNFRPGKSTVAHMLAFSKITEVGQRHSCKAIIKSVDL